MNLKRLALYLGLIVAVFLVFAVLLKSSVRELEVPYTEDLGELIEIRIVNYQTVAIKVSFIYENGTIEKTVFGLVFSINMREASG